MRRGLLSCAVVAAALAALLYEPLFLGRGLGPADSILQFSPWSMDFNRPPSNPLLADQYLSLVPLRHFIHTQGGVPLWNPFVSCGVPALAWIQSASLYPINLLLDGLSPFRAAGWAAFIKLLLAGVFSLLYLRRLGTSWTAALVPGLCFPLCGFMIVWLGHPHVNCACLLPALAYALECALHDWAAYGPKASWKPWAALGTVYGFALLGGHPPTAIHVTFFLLAYLAFRGRPHRALWGRFALALVAGTLLASPQLLPYLEYRRAAFAPFASSGPLRGSLHLSLAALLHWGMPLLSGSPTVGFERLRWLLQLPMTDNFNERTGYVGIVPLALALWASLRRPKSAARFHAACVLLGLAVAYGLPPLPRILSSLPLLKDISHARVLLLVCFSLCVLAGLGLDSLRAEKNPQARLAAAATCALGSALYLWLLWEVLRPDIPRLAPEDRSFLLRQLPVLLGGTAVFCLAALRPFAFRWETLCLAWAVFDSLRFAWGYNPSCPRELYYPRTEAIRRIQNQSGLFRTLAMGWTLLPDTPLVYGLQDLRSQDINIAMSRYEELITGRSGSFTFYPMANALPPLLGELNVRYVLADPPWTPPPSAVSRLRKIYSREVDVYEVRDYVDRALVVAPSEILPAPDVLARMRSGHFDPRLVLLLEESPELPAHARGPLPGKASARVLSYSPNEVRVAAFSPGPAFLLLLDTYYPGWKAQVNGRDRAILRADYDFRAVSIPAGRSVTRFLYDPPSFRLGCLLALAGCALLTVMAFHRGR